MITVTQAVEQARSDLVDEAARYWSNQDLIDGLNEGRSLMATMRPTIYEVTEVVTMAAGHRQTLPNASEVLFNCIDNVTSQSRRAITVMDRELLDRVRPRWRSESPSLEVAHYAYMPTEPTIYEVYPPVRAGVQIRISYSKPPVPMVLNDYINGTQLTREGDIGSALVDYMVYWAYMKAADAAPDDGTLAEKRMATFMAKVSGEAMARTKSTPNTTSPGGRTPTAPA